MKWYDIVLSAILVCGIIVPLVFWMIEWDVSKAFKVLYRPAHLRGKKRVWTKQIEEGQINEVVFLGDSLTDFCNLKKYYPDYICSNCGIHGDATRHVLKRLDYVYQLKPKVLVLLIGTNDFIVEHRKVKDIVVNYREIVENLHRELPDTSILLESVYPGYNGPYLKLKKYKDKIIKLNEEIKKIADEYDYQYVDIHQYLVTKKGLLSIEYSLDGCHLNDKGYEIVKTHLTPYIKEAYEKRS